MRSLVSAGNLMRPFRCRDTVVTDTPAACATFLIVDAVGFFMDAWPSAFPCIRISAQGIRFVNRFTKPVS